jgi:hypothetical protein
MVGGDWLLPDKDGFGYIDKMSDGRQKALGANS